MSLGGPTGNIGPDGSRRMSQWPFIGIVVLLIALIILTPNLFSSGTASLETRAQLIVERATPAGNTSFYVESIGASTLYESIVVGFAPLPAWPYSGTGKDVGNWTWVNASETLALISTSALNPVVVNVTVVYAVPSTGVLTEYVGMYGFYLNATSLNLEASNLLPGAAAPPAVTPLAHLPIFLTLAIVTPTGLTP